MYMYSVATIVAKGNPSNNAQLLTAVKAARNITNVIDSMPRWYQAVIDDKGVRTPLHIRDT